MSGKATQHERATVAIKGKVGRPRKVGTVSPADAKRVPKGTTATVRRARAGKGSKDVLSTTVTLPGYTQLPDSFSLAEPTAIEVQSESKGFGVGHLWWAFLVGILIGWVLS